MFGKKNDIRCTGKPAKDTPYDGYFDGYLKQREEDLKESWRDEKRR